MAIQGSPTESGLEQLAEDSRRELEEVYEGVVTREELVRIDAQPNPFNYSDRVSQTTPNPTKVKRERERDVIQVYLRANLLVFVLGLLYKYRPLFPAEVPCDWLVHCVHHFMLHSEAKKRVFCAMKTGTTLSTVLCDR